MYLLYYSTHLGHFNKCIFFNQSQLSGLFLAMLISIQMFWSTLDFHEKPVYTANEHDAVLRLLGAILSLLSLVSIIMKTLVFFLYI